MCGKLFAFVIDYDVVNYNAVLEGIDLTTSSVEEMLKAI